MEERNFDEIMVEKIDNGEEISERDLSELVWGYEISREEGDCGRWTMAIYSIVELCGRFFEIDWEQGLTEYQENEFYIQPYEVEKKEYDKVVHVVEWERVK